MQYEALNVLPFQISNMVYSYLGKSPTALVIEKFWFDFFVEESRPKHCSECDYGISNTDNQLYEGKCHYCNAEALGVEVFKCEHFGEEYCYSRTYEWTKFINTEDGLFCPSCFEMDNATDDESDEEDI
jgi:hypothetical protein